MAKTIVDYVMEGAAAGEPNAVRALKRVLINNAFMSLVIPMKEDGCTLDLNTRRWVHRDAIVKLANEQAKQQIVVVHISEDDVRDIANDWIRMGYYLVKDDCWYCWNI